MDSIKDYCADSEVFIYGAGVWGRLVALSLKECGTHIASFIVSDSNTKFDQILNIPVIRLSEYGNDSSSNQKIIVAVSEKFRREVEENLRKKHISDYYVITANEIKRIEEELKYTLKYNFSNNINVLLYHRVADLTLDPRGLSISVKNFEEHSKYFSEKCNVLRSEDEWTNEPDNIVLTFDDGHYDFCENVVPLLEKYKIPATIFITTGIIGESEELWGDELERIVYLNDYSGENFEVWGGRYDLAGEKERFNSMVALRNFLKNMPTDVRRKKLDELKTVLKCNAAPRRTHRLMTEDEIKRCASSQYVTIGAHTVTHCSLAHETEERQYWEISESKKRLESLIGERIKVFAYPYGEREDFNDQTIGIAKELGFDKIFAVCGGMASSENPYGRIPRNNVAYCADKKSLERRLNYYKYVYGNTAV